MGRFTADGLDRPVARRDVEPTPPARLDTEVTVRAPDGGKLFTTSIGRR
jgi:hypothetical protein